MNAAEGSEVERRGTPIWRLLVSQTAYQLRLARRSPMAAFVTLAIPVMVLLAMGLLYRGVRLKSHGGIGYAQFETPAMLAFAVITACYMSVISTTVEAREHGILMRIHSTPLPSPVYFSGRLASAAVSAAVGIVLVTIVGAVVYDFQVVWSGIPAVAVTVAVAIPSFCVLGLAASLVISASDAALPVAWGTMLPLCFISDVFAPIDGAPGWLKTVASCFPIRPFASSLETALNPALRSPSFPWGHLGVISAWGVAGALVAAVAFRWQPSATGR